MLLPTTGFGMLCFLEGLYHVYLAESGHALITAGCDEVAMRRWFCESTMHNPDLALMKARTYIVLQHVRQQHPTLMP